MPGLFGILSRTPGLSARELRVMGQRMAATMQRLPWMHVDLWSDARFCGGRAHLGVFDPQPQPRTTDDGAVHSWFHGELYPPSGDESVIPAAAEIVRCVGDGGARLATVDGSYALACYTPATQELVLATDHMGSRALYWAETKEWFAYAGEVKALLAIMRTLPELDEIAAMQFLSLDYMLGERTWWKGIELVPPGSRWCISPRGVERRRYWSFGRIRRDVRREPEVRRELARLVSQGVRQRTRAGCVPLLLTGGLDSRLMLAELREQETALTTFTFGAERCSDVRLARHCARLAGVPHRWLPLTQDNWWHRREEAIWQTDGLVNALHLHVAIAADVLHQGNRCTFKHTGDVVFGGVRVRTLATDWRKDPGELLGRWYYLPNPLVGRDEMVEASRGDCAAYLEGPSLDCFTLPQRVRRMALTGHIALSAHCEVVNPAAALPVLTLLLGCVDDAQRADGGLYARYLCERHPTYFANVPCQRTGRGLDESPPVWLVRGVRGRLARYTGRRVNRYRDYFADYPALLRGSGVRNRLLSGDLLLDEYFDGAVRCALMGEAAWDTRLIMAVHTAEIYLRQVAGAVGARDLSQYTLPAAQGPFSGASAAPVHG
ncbi:MAG TPA: asparagine synthase-related protein [Gemmatimonadaceae bacterium]|nr:asparagine synthase-related protein [Gemmatimonadaceae bacterium]